MRIHNTHFKCVAWSFFLLSSLPSFCAFAYHHYAFEKLQSCDWTVLTQNLEERKKWLSSLPWGTVLNNHWSRFEQSFCTIKKSWNQCFLKKISGNCFLPPVDAASQQVFFEMVLLLPGELHSLTELWDLLKCGVLYAVLSSNRWVCT